MSSIEYMTEEELDIYIAGLGDEVVIKKINKIRAERISKRKIEIISSAEGKTEEDRLLNVISRIAGAKLAEALPNFLILTGSVLSGSILAALDNPFAPGDLDIFTKYGSPYNFVGSMDPIELLVDAVGGDTSGIKKCGSGEYCGFAARQSGGISMVRCATIGMIKVQVITINQRFTPKEFVEKFFDLPFLKAYYDGRKITRLYKPAKQYEIDLVKFVKERKSRFGENPNPINEMVKLRMRLKKYRERGYIIYDASELIDLEKTILFRDAINEWFFSVEIGNLIIYYSEINAARF